MSEIILKFKDRELERIPLLKQSITIGRTPTNDIKIDNPAVSQKHAKINFDNKQYIIEDQNSLNGTFVNGKKINKYVLKNRDQIKIGKHIIEILIDDDDINVSEIPTQEVYADMPLDAGGTVVLDTKHHKELMQQNLGGTSGDILKRPRIRVVEGIKKNKDYVMNSDEIRLGKGRKSLVKLKGFFISGKQAVIIKTFSGFVIKHTGGWRPTRVNGRVIVEVPLGNNDVIQIGKNKLIFILD